MKLKTDLSLGQVVKSIAGRDKGRVFLVSGNIDKDHVYLVDGDLRKLDKPKKKKIKHLMIYKDVIDDFAKKIEREEYMNDSFVRMCLNPYKETKN